MNTLLPAGLLGWVAWGLCAQVDEPDLFYPEPGDDQAAAQAQRFCVACPVRAECLAYALAHDERFGIWGGVAEHERDRHPSGAPAGTDPDIDEVVVTRLADGQPVPEASVGERARAAIGLRERGYSAKRIAVRVGAAERQVWRWIARHRDGRPLTPPSGPRAGAA